MNNIKMNCFRLPVELMKKLKQASEKTFISQTKLVILAITRIVSDIENGKLSDWTNK